MRKLPAIHFWRYVLRSRVAVNAVSARREFGGALVRIGGGFGCLHPWPELGDPELEEVLDDLRSTEPVTALARRVVEMAALDASCRSDGLSAMDLSDGPVPESHATVVEGTVDEVAAAVERGFTVIKVKGGRDHAELAGRLDDLSRRWPHLIWRIDFNGVLTKEEVLCFAQCLTDHAWKRIDFLEDPCPYRAADWEEIRDVTSLALAQDRDAEDGSAAEVLVIKPARDGAELGYESGQRLVVTSAMDHPVGQCYAACRAAFLSGVTGRVDHCGLQTHVLFEPSEFSERLGPGGPRFHGPGGLGLGFDDLLEALPWKRLR